jgi:hypothetical protein
MDDNFTVKQEMKIIEFLGAVYFQTPRMKVIKRFFLLILFVGLLLALLDIIRLFLGDTLPWYQIIIDFLEIPLFIVLFLFVFMTLGAILLRMLRPNHFKNVTYHFTHWGMEKIGKGIDFTRPWNKFLKYHESSHFIFLFISENDAHIIQKRMFADEEELESFKKFISGRVHFR